MLPIVGLCRLSVAPRSVRSEHERKGAKSGFYRRWGTGSDAVARFTGFVWGRSGTNCWCVEAEPEAGGERPCWIVDAEFRTGELIEHVRRPGVDAAGRGADSRTWTTSPGYSRVRQAFRGCRSGSHRG